MFDFCHSGGAYRGDEVKGVRIKAERDIRFVPLGGAATQAAVWQPSRFGHRRFAHFGACRPEEIAHEIVATEVRDPIGVVCQ